MIRLRDTTIDFDNPSGVTFRYTYEVGAGYNDPSHRVVDFDIVECGSTRTVVLNLEGGDYKILCDDRAEDFLYALRSWYGFEHYPLSPGRRARSR